ncbi:MAG: hypothetical protein D6692_04845 [Planctomycetota bacterium]|nr:MAG: hypothetical protein D6692_04845 [Planctomycetota bacterium]
MPLVEISALPQPGSVHIPTTLDRVALAVASAIDCDPAVVWVVWRTIDPHHYCVRAHAPATQPQDSHDPIVRISAYEGRNDTTIAATLEAAARTLAGCLGLEPSNIFVIYDELKSGRVHTGGQVRRS